MIFYRNLIGRDEDNVEMFYDRKKKYSYFLDVEYVGMLKKNCEWAWLSPTHPSEYDHKQ